MSKCNTVPKTVKKQPHVVRTVQPALSHPGEAWLACSITEIMTFQGNSLLHGLCTYICTSERNPSLTASHEEIVQCSRWQHFWWSWWQKPGPALIRKHIYWEYYQQLCFWLRHWSVMLLLQLETTVPLAHSPASMLASDRYGPQENESPQKKQWLADSQEETGTSCWHAHTDP